MLGLWYGWWWRLGLGMAYVGLNSIWSWALSRAFPGPIAATRRSLQPGCVGRHLCRLVGPQNSTQLPLSFRHRLRRSNPQLFNVTARVPKPLHLSCPSAARALGMLIMSMASGAAEDHPTSPIQRQPLECIVRRPVLAEAVPHGEAGHAADEE